MLRDARTITGSTFQLYLIKINQFMCLFIYLAHASVCVCSCVGTCIYVWAYGSQGSRLDLFLYCSMFLLGENLTLDLKLTSCLDWLTSWTLEDPLASISQHWAYSCSFSHIVGCLMQAICFCGSWPRQAAFSAPPGFSSYAYWALDNPLEDQVG